MAIYSGAILISLIVYIAVGNYAGRRVEKLDDYFVAGSRAGTGHATGETGPDGLTHDSQVLWLKYGTTLSDGTMIFPSALRDIQGGTGTSLTRLMK